MTRGVLLRLCLTALGVVACSADEGAPRSPADAPSKRPTQADGESAAQGTEDEPCVAEAYAPNLAKRSGDVEVVLVEASPAPPVKGMNALTLALRDASGPLDGATISIKPWMPDHGHGSAWTPVVTANGGGNYAVDKVQLPMAGRWTLLVEIRREGRDPEHVTYSFCVDDSPG